MSVGELKAEVRRRGLDMSGCIEKGDLVELLHGAKDVEMAEAAPAEDEDEVEEVDDVQVGQGYDLANEANVAAREALETTAAAAASSSSAGSSELVGMQVEDLDE